jgi:hypothetical protein
MSNMRNIAFGLFMLTTGLGLIACQSKEIQQRSPASNIINIVDQPQKNKTTTLAPHKVFEPISSQLKQQTKIPVLLPTLLPESDNPLLVAAIENSSPGSYKVMLAFDPQCGGGTACYLGSVSGQQMDGEFVPDGTEVTLANNLPGYFVDASCGANCSDATFSWIEDDNLYQVAIKGGQLETLRSMANSMTSIAN